MPSYQMFRTGTVAAPLTIIGKDLDAGATLNADVAPAQGVLRAGTLMKYDPATKTLTKTAGATSVTDASGILADDYDSGPVGTTAIGAGMIYRRGTFLRQEIESANNFAVPQGSADDIALNDKGIFLELSYEGYTDVVPTPSGVVPFGHGDFETIEAEREQLVKEGGTLLPDPNNPNPAPTTGPTTEPPAQS